MKITVILFLVGTVSFLSCSNPNKPADTEVHGEHEEGIVFLNALQRKALDLQLGPFSMRNLTTVVKTNGQLEVPPSSSAEVTAVVGGNVQDIKVFQGDKVQKGQVLATLRHPDYIALQEEFAEMANKLEFLEMEYERQKELFDNNVGAGRKFQQVKSEYNSAKARYQGLKSRLELLHLSPEKVKEGEISNTVVIVAPISGFVNRINIKVGSYAGAQDILFEMTDNSDIHADFMVYEKDVHLLKPGQKVHFTVANLPGKELLATIFAIGKEFEPNTRAIHIHASLDEPVAGLIPGMYLTGHIHTDDHYTRALPRDAVVTEGTRSYIFVLDPEATEEEHQHEEALGKDEQDKHSKYDLAEGEHAADAHARGNHDVMAFRMTEVVTGMQDEGYTGIKLLNPLPEDAQVVLNAAYYLLADLNKKETEHKH